MSNKKRRRVSIEEFVEISSKEFDKVDIGLTQNEIKRFLKLAAYYAQSNFPYGEEIHHLLAFIYEKDEKLYKKLELVFSKGGA